ncbi:MAG TPA: DUF2752 domain-containing protein [Vicinamibacteria bacterium]|nr:DUF2752 domain-containing protein [Vicinamibacteria bacterium]
MSAEAHLPPVPPRLLRFSAPVGKLPLGAIFAALGALGAVGVGVLRLDRLPLTLCVFKHFTGLPCPTCGSTRAMGRLFALDPAGALAMNPLITAAALLLLPWAAADLLLLTRGRALDLEVSGPAARALRVLAVLALLLNWAFLLAAGR